MKKINTQVQILSLILFILFVGVSIISPSEFLRISNIQSMLLQMSEFGIISLGMMLVILTGGIDLSIINTGVLSSILGALFMRYSVNMGMHWSLSIFIGIIIILIGAILCGGLNGFLVGYLQLPPILVTLGTMSLYQGIAMNITKGSSVTGIPKQFMQLGKGVLFGIPIPLLIYVFVIVLVWAYLNKMPQGMYTYMVGSNKTALEYAGINAKKVLYLTMTASALLTSVAFMIMTSRYNSIRVGYGESYLMKSIAAVVLGGTAITGGEGSIAGVVIAVAILQVLSTGLNMMLISGHIANVIIGCILISVLGANHIYKQFNEKKDIKKMMKVID